MSRFPACFVLRTLRAKGSGRDVAGCAGLARALSGLLYAALILMGASHAQAQDEYIKASYCTNDTYFHFIFEVFTSTSANNAIIWASPDDHLFNSRNEEITVSFNPHTGQINNGPEVTTYGTPAKDRWRDGPVTQFTVTEMGKGVWRIEGDVRHGPHPLSYGDFVLETRFRDFVGADLFSDSGTVGLCAGCIPSPCRVFRIIPCFMIELAVAVLALLSVTLYVARRRARLS